MTPSAVVTPSEQASMRSTLRASNKGKRGRPKKTDGDDDILATPKKPKGRAKAKPKGKPKAAPKTKSALKSKKSKASADLKASDEAEQVFGCARCRFAKKGCTTCKRPGFKSRGARDKVASV